MTNEPGRLIAVLIFPLVFALTAPALPAADAVPDSATIREKMRAANGPAPPVFRETDETVVSNGSTTIERDYVTASGRRYTFDTGRFHTERGVNGTDAWHMNDNGQVILDQPDPGLATREQMTTTVEAIHTPVEGYVIATLNVQKLGRKDYVDSATWRIVRREDISANGVAVTTYDDVRLDHGRMFAHHLHVDNGYAHTTSNLRVTEYAPGDVTAADVAVPNPRRALVEFPAGVSSVDLPVTFTRGHVDVRVMIGNRGLDLVLDSGASGITIDSAVVRELGLPEFGKRSQVTAGRYTTARTIVPEMRVGALAMHDVAVQEIPQGWNAGNVKEVGRFVGYRVVGRGSYEGNVDGAIGPEFLQLFTLGFDYGNSRIYLVPNRDGRLALGIR